MDVNKSKVPNKFQNNGQNKPITSYLQNIKSKYILKLIFDDLKYTKFFKLINYNKDIQNRMDMGLKNYIFEFMCRMEIEIISKK